ncbi:hypothetical protein RND71_010459 [Anisodus tanguticus]|uniref:Uncharacterized protein n=1 Tax=Anisodus tanguticus TaxID=243964 RepID=A0AAE1SJV1_9SOLA|nr:hypothetical protein RND71_010459 [Anisodus tanguticus]
MSDCRVNFEKGINNVEYHKKTKRITSISNVHPQLHWQYYSLVERSEEGSYKAADGRDLGNNIDLPNSKERASIAADRIKMWGGEPDAKGTDAEK